MTFDDVEEFDPLSDDILLQEMVRAIVDYPEDVHIEEYCDVTSGPAKKVLIVRTNHKDCGKVIGKHGRMAELLRTYMTTVGAHQGYPITVNIEGTNHRLRKNNPRIEYVRQR